MFSTLPIRLAASFEIAKSEREKKSLVSCEITKVGTTDKQFCNEEDQIKCSKREVQAVLRVVRVREKFVF